MPTRLAAPLLLLMLLPSFADPQEAAPRRFGAGSPDVIQSLLVKRVDPVYPPLARQARIQGKVVLNIVISKSGDVENVTLVSGHPMLAPAAIEAVKQWKYMPYMPNGEPAAVQTSVQVDFKLADKPPENIAGDAPGGLPPGAIGSIASGSRVRVSESVMRGLRIQQMDPVYPPYALQSRVEGPVVLDVYIDNSGAVEKVDLISGHPLLAPAAIEAVKQWRYRPYVYGNPAPVETTATLIFTLSADHPGEGIVRDAPPAPPNNSGVFSGIISSAPPAGSRLPQRVRVSSGVALGLLVKKVDPEYPADAKEQHIQGVVVLKENIDKEGNVYNVELISGHPLLAPAAMDAVRQWKYKPYLLNGIPVAVETQAQVNFTLSDN